MQLDGEFCIVVSFLSVLPYSENKSAAIHICLADQAFGVSLWRSWLSELTKDTGVRVIVPVVSGLAYSVRLRVVRDLGGSISGERICSQVDAGYDDSMPSMRCSLRGCGSLPMSATVAQC